jgi:outer membrane receptor for ferrienterochelin and colicins
VTAQISYTIPKAELTIRVGYKYTGKKLIYTVNSSQTTGTRDPYHTLDISMARNFWHDRIQLNIGAKNILNVTNIATPGASGGAHTGSSDNTLIGWGRTYFISLVLHYGT